MVFASIREHASTAIFLRARAEIENLRYNSQAARTSYIFRLQQSIGNPFFFFKQNRKYFKTGFLKRWQNFCGRPSWCSILRDYFGNKNDLGGFKTNSTWNRSCTLRFREQGFVEALVTLLIEHFNSNKNNLFWKNPKASKPFLLKTRPN